MNTVKVENCKTLFIGRRGENEVTEVVFDFSEWQEQFGAGVIDLYVKRSVDFDAYPVVLSIDGTVATWIVTDADTAVVGSGKIEFVYTVDQKVAKSAIFPFYVGEDIGQASSEPPDPYESWIETLTELGTETQANAQAAAQSASDAADSAASASESAGQAEDSAEDAEAWAVGERNGEPVSAGDETYENNAKYWAENARANAPVQSVNGKDGNVELTLDDIPNGATFARATPEQLAQIGKNADDIADIDAMIPSITSESNHLVNVSFLTNRLTSYRTSAAQDTIDAGKQEKITAYGILKRDRSGNITAAIAGADYVTADALNSYRKATAQDAIDNAQNQNIDKNTAAINTMQPAATAADIGKALIVKTVADGKPTSYEYGEAGGGSTLTAGDGIDLTNDVISNTQGIEYIVGTQTAATSKWTGVSTDETLKAGKIIAYYLPFAGTSTVATLALTMADGTTTREISLQYKPNSSVTTQFPAGSIIILVYDGTYWRVNASYDTDTNTYPTGYCVTNGSVAAKAAACSFGYRGDATYFPCLFRYANTAADATLAITTYAPEAAPIYVNGARTSAENTFSAGVILFLYYNGAYYCYNDGRFPILVDGAVTSVQEYATGLLVNYRTAAAQDTIDAGKQAKITASGILKGDGAGGVSAAVAGVDYLKSAPVTSVNGQTGDVTIQTATDAQVTTAVNTWLGENVAQETGYVLDASLTMSNAAPPASAVGDLKSAITHTGELIYSANKYNPNESEIGLLGGSGDVYSGNTSYRTSGFIPAVGGDTVYLAGVKSDGTYVYAAGVIAALCWYDSSKTFIGRAANTNDYKIPASNAAFIRVSFSITGSFGTARIVSITLNSKPLTNKEIRRWFEPYRIANSIPLNVNVVDCWGDSRTEMIYDNQTAFSDYLQTKLGTSFCVNNRGKSAQASGMVSARLGSNEIFVTVENNRILASGETHITSIFCTSGLINNFLCQVSTASMPCTLGGVKGAIYKTAYNNYTTCYFVREVSGEVVAIPPHTKVIVEDYGSKHHAVILWWGKNDMLTTAEGREGLKDIYNKAVEWLGHDRFIILGETCSLNETYYGTGKTLKVWVDDFNAYMMRKYPDNFIDVNAWLSSEAALTSVGLTPTAVDLTNIEKGWPCDSLMVHSTNASDEVHPNQKGREAIANRIYDWMVAHNWVL